MPKPTALAPTVELATPRVRRFVDTKLLECLGDSARVIDFYLCEPPTNQVYTYAIPKGDEWIEASWGLTVETDHVDTMYLPDIMALSKTILVGEVITIHPKDTHTLEVRFWLHARVMRH
jgi:hypothetical protein